AQARAPERGLREVRAFEVRAIEVRAIERGLDQLRLREIEAAQVRAGELLAALDALDHVVACGGRHRVSLSRSPVAPAAERTGTDRWSRSGPGTRASRASAAARAPRAARAPP